MAEQNQTEKERRKKRTEKPVAKQREWKKKKEEIRHKLKGVFVKKAQNTVKQNKLELLVTIVERGKAEYYIDVLQAYEVNMQCVALGHGTADAKTLGILGLSETEKAVIFSVIQENKIPDAMRTLEEKFATIKNGKGIAYTLPFDSVIGTLIYGFLSNNRMAVKESKA